MWKIKIIKTHRKTLALQVKNGEVIVRAPFFTFDRTIKKFIKKHESWIAKKLEKSKKNKSLSSEEIYNLKLKAYNYIPIRVKKLASKYNFKFNKIRITSAKTRWWSCSYKKNLNFSYRLMKLPPDIIDYIIIHELAHLKHMNHSKKFWNCVESMMDNYKEKEKFLKSL